MIRNIKMIRVPLKIDPDLYSKGSINTKTNMDSQERLNIVKLV